MKANLYISGVRALSGVPFKKAQRAYTDLLAAGVAAELLELEAYSGR